MLKLQFYTRKDCTLCHSALALMRRLQNGVPFELDVIDVDTDSGLAGRYGDAIPVVTAGNQELARSFFDEKKLALELQKLSAQA